MHPAENETASLLYTSGTTGNPKGVILSHGNIASNVIAVQELSRSPEKIAACRFSLGPLVRAHGRAAPALSIGASIGICETIDKIIEYLGEVKPTILFSVPRIFNRIYAGVRSRWRPSPAPIHALFRAGMKAAIKRRHNKPLSVVEALTLALADRVGLLEGARAVRRAS